MAPILKEVEAPVATPTASAPAAPHAKPTNETATRPQPVALEIPVTVNGARTVDGSDKRVPFSESTQTVLVFPHGAVIRTATQLVAGQLVFLTNEKTKKEVVCQVVKSKSTGASGAYVELQFTEPSVGFWGLQIPGASAAPAVPRLVPPAAPAAPKAAAPSTPVAVKPPVAPKPVAPAPTAISAPPPKPLAPPPPPPPVVPSAPAVVLPEPVVSAMAEPPVSIAPPPTAVTPQMISHPESPKPVAPLDAAPQVPVIAEPPVAAPPVVAEVAPPVPATHLPVTPVLPLRDYSKQIDALFSAPHVPAAPISEPPAAASSPAEPSSEELKHQAARLQAQLSSLLFTESPSAKPAAPVASKPEPPAAEVAKKILEIAHEETKPMVPSEPKPVSPSRTPSHAALGADEEVKIPSWLAPLSQKAETPGTESGNSSEASLDTSVSVNSEESYDALVAAAPHRSETAVFGGQLLGESAASASASSSGGSKKGLFLGLAAAALLAVGGAWYFLHQNQSGSSATVAAAHAISTPTSNESAPANNLPTTPATSTPARNNVNSSPAPSQPARNSIPTANPPAAISPTQPKNSKSTSKNPEPVEEPAKPSLGDVHLAAPVVNRSADASQGSSDTLPSIDTKTVPASSDPFASTASPHTPPAAPLPVGGDVQQARLLKSVPPVYPAIAKAQRLSGRVQVDALIDASGNVATVKVISGPPLLHNAAVDAVKQWKYAPAMLDGQPTPMHLTVTVEFRGQ
jgi:TonB family protein